MTQPVVFIDCHGCTMTMSQMRQALDELKAEHPDMEIYMDGDRYAIVGKQRAVA